MRILKHLIRPAAAFCLANNSMPLGAGDGKAVMDRDVRLLRLRTVAAATQKLQWPVRV